MSVVGSPLFQDAIKEFIFTDKQPDVAFDVPEQTIPCTIYNGGSEHHFKVKWKSSGAFTFDLAEDEKRMVIDGWGETVTLEAKVDPEKVAEIFKQVSGDFSMTGESMKKIKESMADFSKLGTKIADDLGKEIAAFNSAFKPLTDTYATMRDRSGKILVQCKHCEAWVVRDNMAAHLTLHREADFNVLAEKATYVRDGDTIVVLLDPTHGVQSPQQMEELCDRFTEVFPNLQVRIAIGVQKVQVRRKVVRDAS